MASFTLEGRIQNGSYESVIRLKFVSTHHCFSISFSLSHITLWILYCRSYASSGKLSLPFWYLQEVKVVFVSIWQEINKKE
jgi:hypothetical protein